MMGAAWVRVLLGSSIRRIHVQEISQAPQGPKSFNKWLTVLAAAYLFFSNNKL